MVLNGKEHYWLGKKDFLPVFVNQMIQFYGNSIVFDETGYKDLIYVKFSADIPAVRAGLKPYGLDLRAEERELEVFFLTELSNRRRQDVMEIAYILIALTVIYALLVQLNINFSAIHLQTLLDLKEQLQFQFVKLE